MLLVATVLVCAVVAALVGRPVWAAVVGSSLAIVYWAIEAITWQRARRRRDLAVGLAVGGMVVRLVVVLAALVVVGLLAQPAFATTALSFVVGFSAYLGVRLVMFPAPQGPAGHVGVHR